MNFRLLSKIGIISALMAIFFFTSESKAQLLSETEVEISQGTWNPIDTYDATFGPADDTSYNFDFTELGFPFYYDGQIVETLTLNCNGVVGFGNSTKSFTYGGGNPTNVYNSRPGILVMAEDGYVREQSGFKVEGNPGSRVCIIQFNGYTINYSSTYQNNKNYYQVRLYEGSNMVELIYGPKDRGGYNMDSRPAGIAFTGWLSEAPYSYYNFEPSESGSLNDWMIYTPESAEIKTARLTTNARFDAMIEGTTITLGGSSTPKLISAVPEHNTVWGLGREYTEVQDHPAAYVIRTAEMESCNLEMNIYRKGETKDDYIYRAVRNNITPESPDDETPVKVEFINAIGDAAGANGVFDLRSLNILPGDYVVKTEMTMNSEPGFLKEVTNDIVLPVDDDLSVYKIVSPKDFSGKIYSLERGTDIEIIVRNAGLNERAEWTLNFELRDDNDEVVYESEFNYPEDDADYPNTLPLASNSYYTVHFPTFFPDNIGEFKLLAQVSYEENDQMPGNDRIPALGEEYVVRFAREVDLRVAKMVKPANAEEIIVLRPVKPECSFTNIGANDATENEIRCEIKYNDEVVYSDVLIDQPINNTDTTVVKFNKDFVPTQTGTYTSHFYITSEEDNSTDYKEKHEMFFVVAALEGVYTIGLANEPGEGDDPNPRNFATLQEAVDALYEFGVTSPVVFEFTDRHYTVGDLGVIKAPALDLTTKIAGMSAENTVTFRPSSERAVEQAGPNSGVTIDLLAGNGHGIEFGQNPFPSNPNAIAYYSDNPKFRLADDLLPKYITSEGYFIFDGLRNKSLRFTIHTPVTSEHEMYHNVPFFFREGTKNITVQNCVFENPMSDIEPAHSILPHTKRKGSTLEYQPERNETYKTAYSAAIAMRAEVPVFEDGQNRLNFDTLTCEHNTIRGNVISGFGYGIVSMGAGPILQEMSGLYARFYNNNNTYADNKIFNVAQAGIFLGYEENSVINHNRIYNVTGTSPDLENNNITAGIICGDKGDPYDPSWNMYHNVNIQISNNEISGVNSYAGDPLQGTSCGIYVVQSQNQMINPASGYTYFPDTEENFVIKNNIVRDINISSPEHERAGIKITTTKVEDTYKTRNDIIVNNTIILEDDAFVTKGDLTCIYLDGSENARILNNALAILDNEIFHDDHENVEDFKALIHYAGVMPGLEGGLISNRNAFWKTPLTDPNDKTGVAVYSFKEYYTDTEEWLPYFQDDYESLRQWRNHSKQDYNSMLADFTSDYALTDNKLRIVEPYPTGSVLNNRAENLYDVLTKDIDGNVRGQAGAMFDIGACEFNGALYLQDMEIKTISEPSVYQAGEGRFSDAEYIMTALPIDNKVIIRNSGSLDQSGVKLTLKVYRENADGVFTDEPLDVIEVFADVVTSQSVEVSFNLPAIEEAKEEADRMFKTYADLRGSDPEYFIPEHFRGEMEYNVTPRYKFEIEIRPDEDNSNNYASSIVRFFIKKSTAMSMLISGENLNTNIRVPITEPEPDDDVQAGRLNYENLAKGFEKFNWFTDIATDTLYDDDEIADLIKVDVLDRNSWEPRAIDYALYKFLFWSDGDDKALTRNQKWDIEDYLASGVQGNKKNFVVSSQEIVHMNAFKNVHGDWVEDQSFVNKQLRAALVDGVDYLNPATPWAAGTDGKNVIGVKVDRDQVRSILATPLNIYDWNKNGVQDDDPAPFCGLMDINNEGDGLTSPAYFYAPDAQRTDDSLMGTATVAYNRNIIVMGVDWRHWGDCESVLRGMLDFIIENDGLSVPVELTEFNASPLGNKVVVSWMTASELNSDKFVVEKAVVNNNMKSSFNAIATVDAAGKSAYTKAYGPVVDTDVQAGGEYAYRLAMIDLDGTVEYSDERIVNFGVNGALTIGQAYPNPADTKVSFKTNASADASVVVYNANGAVVTVNSEIVDGCLNIDLANLASGSYRVIVKSDNTVMVENFNVVK